MAQDADFFPQHGELAALMRSKDWTGTPLGSPSTWPTSLRTVLRLMLTSRYAMWMGWGPDLTFFYNDAYGAQTLGAKHPWALGQPAREVWKEIWDLIGPRIEHVIRTGEATWDEGLLLFLERSGYPEETYHTFSYSPAPGDAPGAIAGMFCVVVEETERVIGQRRIALLRDFAALLSQSKTTENAFAALERCLTAEARDIPFSLTYLVEDDGKSARRVSQTGFAGAHPGAPERIGTDSRWSIASVVSSGVPLVVDLAADEGWPVGAWKRSPAQALVVPIARPSGVFIAGANPHRPLDKGLRGFVELFAGQLAAGLSSAQAYEAEKKRAEALAEIDRAKTAFFSNVSHEFRTPLTLMLAPQEDALGSRDGVLGGEDLRAVHRNTLRLLKLVNNLLDFSRIEAGRVEASYVPTDLSALTTDLTSAFRSAFERAGLKFEVECPPLPEPIYVDRDMWEKIVLNLLSNALKFTFDGTVRASLRVEGDHVELQVEDTGVGIPEHELPRLFERFHRIEGTRSRTYEGSGIGLSLVHDLVKLHGGNIQTASRPGQGTTFVVSIPTGSAHLPADRVRARRPDARTADQAEAYVTEALRWLPEAAAALTGPTTGGAVNSAANVEPAITTARVLVADDNADMRDYLARLLGAHWIVEAVADGAQALAAARERRPDVIVSDVMMPNLDGFGLLRALRDDQDTANIPVIMLSARAGEESRLGGLEAGADDYLVKPFVARELVARIETHLKLARARGEGARQWRRLLSLLDQMPTPMSLLRLPERRYEFSNRAHAQLTGRSVAGKTLDEAYPDLADKSEWTIFDQVAASKQALVRGEVPTHLRWGDGAAGTRYLTTVMQPWIDEDGTVAGVLNVSFDVTDQVTARRELDVAREAAETANRAKDAFLAMLGHELRNPLAPILNAAQLMRLRGKDGPELSMIQRQASHLIRLVDDLLDVSRITLGKIELRKQRLELRTIVFRGIELASPLIEDRQQKLDVQVPTAGMWIEGDADRLAQVISNLLTNAAKYSEPGSAIHVRAGRSGEIVRLHVVDEGIGVEPEMLGRIFDSFVQQPQALDRSKGGLGLGLTIVRSLVQLHGGTVEARSDGLGKGSEFIVELPLASGAAEFEHAPGREIPTHAAPAAASKRGTRILVVDDNQDAAESIGELLVELGHEVQLAHDGPTALEVARQFRPSICLLDIGLPVMDGYVLARALRQTEEMPADLRLIALTGYGQQEDRRRSIEAGFNGHLVKPVDFDVLTSIVSD